MKQFVWMICLISFFTDNALAISWQSLWLRDDERARQLLAAGKPVKANELFDNPQWQAVANYRSGKYALAAEQFAEQNNADGFYNQGNALAHAGKYPQAVRAYNQALSLEASHEDAKYNKAIVEKLLTKKQKKSIQNSANKNAEKKAQQKNQQQGQNNKRQPQAKKQKMASKDKEHHNLKSQLLRRVPDDPGGLVAQKIWRDTQRYRIDGLYQESE